MTTKQDGALGVGRVDQPPGAATSAALAHFGLTPRQYDALVGLVDLRHAPDARPERPAPACPPALDTVVADLERRGLVDRAYDERRSRLVHVRLTDAGFRVRRAAAAAVEAATQFRRADPRADGRA